MAERFLPSNADEGLAFVSRWCGKCSRGKPAIILGNNVIDTDHQGVSHGLEGA